MRLGRLCFFLTKNKISNDKTRAHISQQVFESGDIEAISNKLFSMQKSLAMLANVVDYEDKKLQLEGLKNRLEAMASPRLVQAFTAANLGKVCHELGLIPTRSRSMNAHLISSLCAEQSKLYVDIFSKMERLPQLLKYYHNCLKVSLGQEWRRTIELVQDENVTYWLHTYYDKLLSSWHEQVCLWVRFRSRYRRCEIFCECILVDVEGEMVPPSISQYFDRYPR